MQKRPLLRAPIPASSKAPVVYISSRTPFMSAVRRVRKLLARGTRQAAKATKNASLHARVEALQRDAGGEGHSATVTVRGTGKAIEKTVNLAAWFQDQKDCVVTLRTGTVGAVDDVVADDGEDESRVRKLSTLEVAITLK